MECTSELAIYKFCNSLISFTLDAPQFLIRHISFFLYKQPNFLIPKKLYIILIEVRLDIPKNLLNTLLKTTDIFVT